MKYIIIFFKKIYENIIKRTAQIDITITGLTQIDITTIGPAQNRVLARVFLQIN